jgi:hypothetical protein
MKKRNNHITIHKANELTRGSDIYSLDAKKAMNTIDWLYQKHNLYKHPQISIRFSTLREKMDLENDGRYVERIKEAMLELMKPMQLNKFYHPLDGVEYSWFAITFLYSAGFTKCEDEWIVNIELPLLMRHVMQVNSGNFTEIALLPYMNKFRSKYTMKLYEYLKSFATYKYLNISHKHLLHLFGVAEDDKTYRYYSKFTVLVERSMKEIQEKSDLTEVKLIQSKLLAKEGVFKFIINAKSTKDVEAQEAKAILESLIKRF